MTESSYTLWFKLSPEFDSVPIVVDPLMTIHELKVFLKSEEMFELTLLPLHKMRLFRGESRLDPRYTVYEMLEDDDEIEVRLPHNLMLPIPDVVFTGSEYDTNSGAELEMMKSIVVERASEMSKGVIEEVMKKSVVNLVARLDELDDKVSYKNDRIDLAMKDLRMLMESFKAMPMGQTLSKLESYKCKETLVGHEGPVWTVQCGVDTLYTGSSDSTINVWDLTTGKVKYSFSGHKSIVHALAVTNDEETVISGSDDKTIKIWSTETLKCKKTIRDDNIACCIRLSNNNLFAGSFKCVKIYSLETYEEVYTLPGHNHWVRAIEIGNGHLFSGGHNIVKMWDLGTFQCIKTLEQGCGSVYSLSMTENLVVAGAYDNTIYIWDLRSREWIRALPGHTGAVYSLAVNGNKVYSGSYDNTIKCWDLRNFNCEHQYLGHTSSIESLSISENFGLISASTDSSVKIWRL